MQAADYVTCNLLRNEKSMFVKMLLMKLLTALILEKISNTNFALNSFQGNKNLSLELSEELPCN